MSDQQSTRQLREFAKRVIACHTGSLDGWDIEDMAVECGLLAAVEAKEPCSEDTCACAEFGFPLTCYRATALLNPALDEKPSPEASAASEPRLRMSQKHLEEIEELVRDQRFANRTPAEQWALNELLEEVKWLRNRIR